MQVNRPFSSTVYPRKYSDNPLGSNLRFGAESMTPNELTSAIQDPNETAKEYEIIDALKLLPESERIPFLEQIASLDGKKPGLQCAALFDIIPELTDEQTQLRLLSKTAETKTPFWVRKHVATTVGFCKFQNEDSEYQAAQLLREILSNLDRKDISLWGGSLSELVQSAGTFKDRENKMGVVLAVLSHPEAKSISKIGEDVSQMFSSIEDRAELLKRASQAGPRERSGEPTAFQFVIDQVMGRRGNTDAETDLMLQLCEDAGTSPEIKMAILRGIFRNPEYKPSARLATHWETFVPENVNLSLLLPSVVRLVPFLTPEQKPLDWLKTFINSERRELRHAVAALLKSGTMKNLSAENHRKLLTELYRTELSYASTNITDAIARAPRQVRKETIQTLVEKFRTDLEQLTQPPDSV